MNDRRQRWTRREALLGLGALAGAWAVAEGPGAKRAWAQGAALQTEKLTDSLHIVTGAGGNIGVLTGADGTLVIDTGLTPQTDDIIKAIKAIHSTPVQMVVNTHWHFDHVGSNEALAHAGARIVAHTNTRKRLSTDQTIEFFNKKFPAPPKSALPVLVFEEGLTLYWNDEEIHLQHVKPAHTDADILVHFRNSNILHAGDLLFNGFYPFIDYSTKGWIGGMVAGADKITALSDAQTKIIPGHGPMATRADVQAFRDMLATIQERIEKLIKEGKSVDEVIAAKPTADQDAKWGQGFLKPDDFARLAYLTIAKHQA